MEDLVVLRPNAVGSIQPYEIHNIIGKKINKDLEMHQDIKWQDLI